MCVEGRGWDEDMNMRIIIVARGGDRCEEGSMELTTEKGDAMLREEGVQ